MESDLRSTAAIVEVPSVSGVSWAAIAAGAVAAAALALLLIAFGAGLGLSAVSPWSDSSVSSTTFSVGTGIYLIVVAVMSSAIGGYLAGRLRTHWRNLDRRDPLAQLSGSEPAADRANEVVKTRRVARARNGNSTPDGLRP